MADSDAVMDVSDISTVTPAPPPNQVDSLTFMSLMTVMESAQWSNDQMKQLYDIIDKKRDGQVTVTRKKVVSYEDPEGWNNWEVVTLTTQRRSFDILVYLPIFMHLVEFTKREDCDWICRMSLDLAKYSRSLGTIMVNDKGKFIIDYHRWVHQQRELSGYPNQIHLPRHLMAIFLQVLEQILTQEQPRRVARSIIDKYKLL